MVQIPIYESRGSVTGGGAITPEPASDMYNLAQVAGERIATELEAVRKVEDQMFVANKSAELVRLSETIREDMQREQVPFEAWGPEYRNRYNDQVSKLGRELTNPTLRNLMMNTVNEVGLRYEANLFEQSMKLKKDAQLTEFENNFDTLQTARVKASGSERAALDQQIEGMLSSAQTSGLLPASAVDNFRDDMVENDVRQFISNGNVGAAEAALAKSTISQSRRITLENSIKAERNRIAAGVELNNAIDEGVTLNPAKASDMRIADKMYEARMAVSPDTALSDVVRKTGVIPPVIATPIVAALISDNAPVKAKAEAAQNLFSIEAMLLQSFPEGSIEKQIGKAAYKDYVAIASRLEQGIGAEEAVKDAMQYKDASDAIIRKAKEVSNEMLLNPDRALAQAYAPQAGLLSGKIPFTDRFLALPESDRAAVANDYAQAYSQEIVNYNGDESAARKATDERMTFKYGLEKVDGKERFVSYPLERFYGNRGGSSESIRLDLEKDLKELVPSFKPEELGSKYRLVSDAYTALSAQAGNPTKVIMQFDDAGNPIDVLRFPDGLPVRFQPSLNNEYIQKKKAEVERKNRLREAGAVFHPRLPAGQQ